MNNSVPRPEQADSVSKALGAVRRGWLLVVAAGVLFGIVGLAVSLVQTPRYEATAAMYVTSGSGDGGQNAYQGPQASQQRVQSYTRLVSSDAVVSQALQIARLTMSVEEARKEVSASASVDTVLLNISAVDTNRSVAERLVDGIATAMTSYVTRLETPSGGGQPLAKLTLVTPATSDADPVSPKTARNVLLAVVAGVVVGALAIALRAQASARVRTEKDVAQAVATPVLGVIPRDDHLRAGGLIDFRDGSSAPAEAFRKVRTALTFTRVDQPPRILLVTSPTAAEGKTTVAMNLAAAVAESGQHVVIVDGDLRRPQVNRRSGLLGDVGLTNWLRGDGELSDLLQPSNIDNLWVLAAGAQAPNPAELLGTKRTEAALNDLAGSFDVVIVDSPPVLPVTDSVVLSQWVDGTIIVARSGSTRMGDLTSASEQLAAGGSPVLGVVIADSSERSARYDYHAGEPRRSLLRRRSPKSDASEALR